MGNFSVCPKCDGEGKILNEAFTEAPLEPELVADPDFMEEMSRGAYNVTCPLCKGKRVVTTQQLQADEDDEEWRDEIRRERLMMGGR